MERRRGICFLGAEAAACAGLALAWRPDGASLAGALAFPFAPLGQLLRRMSLAGVAQNAAAVGLYGLVCLLPAGYLAARAFRRRCRPEDGLLAVMSGLLFWLVYRAVNPGLLPESLGRMGLTLGGGVFWTLAAAYVTLRALRGCLAADERGLRRYARAMLWVLAALAVFGAFGASLMTLLGQIRQARGENPDAGRALTPTYVVLGLRCAVSAGAYLLDLTVVFGAMDVLSAWEREPYSSGTVAAAGTLARRCARTLAFTALTGAALALVQLLWAGEVRMVSVSVTAPLLSMGLVLAALLLAQYLRAGKALKDDNDLFI